MKKVYYRVRLGTERVTVERLSDKSRTAVRMMTGNAAYPTPNPALADVEAAADTLDAAQEAYAFNRGKLEKDARDTAFLALKELYSGLGAYVQTTSGGDKELILSAGFDTRREPSPQGLLPAPGNVRAEVSPYKGRLIARWDGVAGRSIYKLYMTTGDPTVDTGWELLAETGKTRFVVDGLESFRTYSFRVVAVGTEGNSVPSDHASATAA